MTKKICDICGKDALEDCNVRSAFTHGIFLKEILISITTTNASPLDLCKSCFIDLTQKVLQPKELPPEQPPLPTCSNCGQIAPILYGPGPHRYCDKCLVGNQQPSPPKSQGCHKCGGKAFHIDDNRAYCDNCLTERLNQ